MKSLPNPTSVGVFFGNFGNVNMSPRYQRDGGIWSLAKQQLFIDSLMNGFDIPKIYFNDVEEDDTRFQFAVIDGKQRLTTIVDFLENKFPLGKEFKVTVTNPPEGKKPGPNDFFKDFSEKYKDHLKNFSLPIVLIQRATEDDIEELFSRLNSGERINSAEARNAKGGSINRVIDELQDHKFLQKKIGFDNTRFKFREVLCRLLYIDWIELKTPRVIPDLKKKNLDDFVEQDCHDLTSEMERKLKQSCAKNLDLMYKIFPEEKSEVLRLVTVPQLYYLFIREISREYYHRELNGRLSDFFPRFISHKLALTSADESVVDQEELLKIKDYNYYAGQGTNSSDGMRMRIDILTEYFLKWNLDLEIKNQNRSFSPEERYVIWVRDGKRCVSCTTQLVNLGDMDADHIIEYQFNGATTLANARALCVNCNRSRRSTT